ncbi:hypothetical protein NDU88_006406 [Pleurodeles waltl]|uniref:Uncharacterized protein n=1 Tax=Pleurodeles waltl TaxID=8319 RepID=A0AAV7UPX3_PLEWA|nr:hypothetical protein NDU88_006406 [Pleurodeles waltl]
MLAGRRGSSQPPPFTRPPRSRSGRADLCLQMTLLRPSSQAFSAGSEPRIYGPPTLRPALAGSQGVSPKHSCCGCKGHRSQWVFRLSPHPRHPPGIAAARSTRSKRPSCFVARPRPQLYLIMSVNRWHRLFCPLLCASVSI